MRFLFNERKAKAKAHIWLGDDTACRMWSTGGMKCERPGWVIRNSDEGREHCHMCSVGQGLEPCTCGK